MSVQSSLTVSYLLVTRETGTFLPVVDSAARYHLILTRAQLPQSRCERNPSHATSLGEIDRNFDFQRVSISSLAVHSSWKKCFLFFNLYSLCRIVYTYIFNKCASLRVCTRYWLELVVALEYLIALVKPRLDTVDYVLIMNVINHVMPHILLKVKGSMWRLCFNNVISVSEWILCYYNMERSIKDFRM